MGEQDTLRGGAGAVAEAVPIPRILARLAEAQPDRLAVVMGEESVTRGELERRTNRLARAFQALGVGQDGLVAICLPNGIAHIEAAIAAWKLGATPLPLSHRLPQPELEALIELARPALVVGRDPVEFPWQTFVPAGYEADVALPDGPLPERIARHWKVCTSGGSTGRPKLIVAAQPGATDLAFPKMLRILPDRVMLVPGPLYHNAPFASSASGLFMGNTLVLLPRFDAEATLAALARWRVDWVLLVPTMMHRIWRLGPDVRARYDLSALRIALHMAAPCPPWLKECWIGWLGPQRIHELYAGTEVQAITWITGEEWLTHRGSVGRVLPGGQMRVLDEAGQPVPNGTVGEVYMRPDAGRGTTYHYVGAEPKRRDEWESLGDMGWMDDEGYVYLADRQTDMILSGGANIYPAEVEAALEAHPGVRSSCVIGLPDEDLGQRVHALVDCQSAVTEQALWEHVAGRLAPYKVPRSFEFVSEPLRDDAGKVRRSALRQARLAGRSGA